jgi:DNA-binding PadR family transcriptional regulator
MGPGRKALGPLGIAVLALLAEGPMHPYEMYQLLMHRGEDRFVKVRPGSLYHTVDRLALEKLVRETGTDREGNRPERTIYEITAAGRDVLTTRIREVLGSADREYPLFPVALAEAHNLPADEVVQLLRRRIEAIHDDMAELDAVAELAQREATPRVFLLGVGYLRTVADAEQRWLTDLTAQIEAGELPWLPEALSELRRSERVSGTEKKSRVNS